MNFVSCVLFLFFSFVPDLSLGSDFFAVQKVDTAQDLLLFSKRKSGVDDCIEEIGFLIKSTDECKGGEIVPLLDKIKDRGRTLGKNAEAIKIKNSKDCFEITKHFEEVYDIPSGLLMAIAMVESRMSPWAVNNLVESRYFKRMDDAVEYVERLAKTRQSSISVGYMQINWDVHKRRFSSIAEAMTPYSNIKFAAQLLVSLHKRFGSWEKALGWYNPTSTGANKAYVRKVFRHWNNYQKKGSEKA
jgi:hypothetical protein